MMGFDDGATDREADSHASSLRRVEGVKESLRIVWTEAHAGILNGQAHTIAVVVFGPDQELPRTILDGAHRFRGVQEQVQHHLLQLDAVTGNRGQMAGQIRRYRNPASVDFVSREQEDLANDLINIQQLPLGRRSARESANPSAPAPVRAIEPARNPRPV